MNGITIYLSLSCRFVKIVSVLSITKKKHIYNYRSSFLSNIILKKKMLFCVPDYILYVSKLRLSTVNAL